MSKGGVGVDVKQLAALLDLDVRRVQQLAQQGIVVKVGHGRYALKQSLHGYIRYLRETAGRPPSNAKEEMDQLRLEILRMERDNAALDLAVKQGQLVTLDFLEDRIRDVAAPVGLALNNMAGILTPQVAEQPAPVCMELIESYVEEVKAELRDAFEAALVAAERADAPAEGERDGPAAEAGEEDFDA